MTDLLGTRAAGVTGRQHATVQVADQVHPASKPLPQRWRVADHWYDFTGNVRGESHVLATVDENSYDGGSMGFDHPIAWCKDHQGGRSFYTGRGGSFWSYLEHRMRQHLLGAIGPLGAVEVRLDAVDGPILLTAALTGTASETVWQSQTFPLSDPGGVHDLYLVFREVPGGSTGNSTFNLNWAEFGGQGVGAP